MRLRYEEHTWPELRELAKRDDLVVVIPTATLEDHGYHLPIDTDARLVSAICERAVAASGGQALLFPTQVHGYTSGGSSSRATRATSSSGPGHPYTKALVEAIPPRKQRIPLGGELPDATNLPAGCRFHPRCPQRFEPCDRDDPPLFGAGEPGHEAACLLLKH